MIDRTDKRLRRRIAVISHLKAGRPLSSSSLASLLAREKIPTCPKTVQRDIQAMQVDLDAPIDYDPTTHGYHLTDPRWTFPTDRLEDDALLADLVAHRLTAPLLPPPLQGPLSEAERIHLAAGEAAGIDDTLLRSVIQATSAKVFPDDYVFENVLDAWRDSRLVEIDYSKHDGQTTRRHVEPHALFLAAGAWYIRGYCRLRRKVRNFAIHRCREIRILSEPFQRSPAILAGLNHGNPFDYREVRNVVLRTDAEKAPVLREREWFPGQTITENPDRTLTLRFPSAPEPLLLRWILSYAPHITILEPDELRVTVRDVSAQLHEHHLDDSIPPTSTDTTT